MIDYKITKPIGLNAICTLIEKNCIESVIYKKCGLMPPHYIVNINPGDGRTTLLEFMADAYKNSDVIDFHSGLDGFIEIKLDGSFSQFKKAAGEIDSAAVYYNSYRGIIGIDASALAIHKNETQWTEYLNLVREISKDAIIVLFILQQPTKNDLFVAEETMKVVDNMEMVDVEPYSKDELASIVERNIISKGVEIICSDEIHSILLNMVESKNIKSVKEALKLTETLIRSADFSKFTPVINNISVDKLLSNLSKSERRI